MIVLVSLIVLLRGLLVHCFSMVHPYISIHSIFTLVFAKLA